MIAAEINSSAMQMVAVDASLAATIQRVLLAMCSRELVHSGSWVGVRICGH